MHKIIPAALGLLLISSTAFAQFYQDPISNSEISSFVNQTDQLRPDVVKTALEAYNCACARGVPVTKPIVTIIDYSLPSSSKRLWVLDLKHRQVLFHTLVAHGKYSGLVDSNSFSDAFGSQASSIGVYVTQNTYFGKDGYSMVLQGLDRGFNDNAKARRIVMHGAWYVSEAAISQHGYVGRSWGCPAIDPKLLKPVVDTIKGGSVILAYYPNHSWLNNSAYLHC
jgi:hypothetical protein